MATILMSITLIVIGIASVIYVHLDSRKHEHEDAE